MPRFPVLSGREIVKALEKLGFEAVRQRGSHVVMRRGNVGCSVPMHREIRTGTLAASLRQADVSLDALLSALDQ